MGTLFKQLGSMLGASFAAVRCLGAECALSALAAIGAGFLIKDAILNPLYLSGVGAVAAVGGLFIAQAVVYAGLAAMVDGSFWNFALRGAGARNPT